MANQLKWQNIKPKKTKASSAPLPLSETYAEGDIVYVRVGDDKALSCGVVLAAFATNFHTNMFYIIMLQDTSFPYLLIRDATLMAGHADGPLPISQVNGVFFDDVAILSPDKGLN